MVERYVLSVGALIAAAGLLAVGIGSHGASGQTVSPTPTPAPVASEFATPTQPPQPTGLTETSLTGQTCTADARVRVDKAVGAGETGTVLEVIAVADGVTVSVGDTVTGLPPGPFPAEAHVVVFRNDAGVLTFGYKSCEGGSSGALPSTGGPP